MSFGKALLLSLMIGAATGCQGEVAVTEEVLAVDATSTWPERDARYAFYSGHSLSDGIPEIVADIAAARGQVFEFTVQSAPYSLLRTRAGNDWSSHLSGGRPYDAIVVTERHDLPWAAAREGTSGWLADLARRAWRENPHADVFFYHTWLALDPADPVPWVRYEQRALRLWECVASRANREIGGDRRIRVLPGGAILARLVEQFRDGQVPGIAEPDPAARVRLLFVDDVHLSPLGRYAMGLVHFAVLFGRPPAGSRNPDVHEETRHFLERFASEQATAYAPVADAASSRDMEACRQAAITLCAASYDQPARGWGNRLLAPYREWRCRRIYADPAHPDNPFGSR